MTATIISNNQPYSWGMATNRMVSGMVQCNTFIERLNEAIATASSGYSGVDGTQFEISNTGATVPVPANPSNLFGVVPSDTPGDQGKAYAYAIGELYTAWQTFWTAAKPYVEQLDNGANIV